MASGSSKVVIYAALAGNLAIALTKFAASWWTGSGAMLSEALHSLVDTSNQGFLLLGLHRAARPASKRHPFGHGMEIYFWAFIVALMIFALGGAASIYEGIQRLRDPEPIRDPWVNFLVLGISFAIEATSLRVAWRELRRSQPDRTMLAALRGSKDPSVFSIFCEDAAALLGLSVAATGLVLAYALREPRLDAAASLAIGGILILTAIFLARETLSLMTGESASTEVLAAVRAVLEGDQRVERIDEILSMHLGPSDVLLGISLDFRDEMTSDEIEMAVHELDNRLRVCQPSIRRVFVRPDQRAKRWAVQEGQVSVADSGNQGHQPRG